MTAPEVMKAIRDGIRAALKKFSNEGRRDREQWIAQGFLGALREPFSESEVVSPVDDPPDIEFRGARFEMKEVFDEGRRRKKEYEEKLRKAEAASTMRELMEFYEPVDATPALIFGEVAKRVEALKKHYAPGFAANLDLLFYFNLQHHHFLPTREAPDVSSLATSGFRSVSVFDGKIAWVIWAADTAPDFLRSRVGTVSSVV